MSKPLAFWASYIFINVAFPFSQSNTSMCDGFCSSLSLFILRFTFVELFKRKHKKMWEDIQAQVYACIKIIKTIDQSFMTSLKIDLQQSHIDFNIFPTKIDVHTEQAKLVNALHHQYEGTRPNSHVIYTTQAIKLFEDSSTFIGF